MAQQHGITEAPKKNGPTPVMSSDVPDGNLSLLWDGLPLAITDRLSQPLEPALVSYRTGQAGKTLPYIEGHAAIGQANRVFGYGGWGYEVVEDVTYKELKSVDSKTGEVAAFGMYCATVRVMVPGVPPRTDLGCQAVAEDASEGHDTACKGAVTDALKRALRSFGDQFGNALYGDAAEKALLCPLKETLAHLGKAQGFTEERLRQAVKQKTGKALDALSASEVATLLQALARRSSPNTTSRPAGSPVR